MQRSPSSSSFSMKIKTLIQNLVFSQLIRVTHVLLVKAKTVLIEIAEEARLKNIQILVSLIFKKKRKKNRLYIGSFRFGYNSSPSHFVPQISTYDEFIDYVYYDYSFEEEVKPDSLLSGYLHWLEENTDDTCELIEINEIDDLAEKFIANCHEKFALEKQESDRRFQEMMARSL
ncbi:hypothetical protein Hdeb2414_s0009g00318121 [Helianthus debilis subsp. tardiflorus]